MDIYFDSQKIEEKFRMKKVINLPPLECDLCVSLEGWKSQKLEKVPIQLFL